MSLRIRKAVIPVAGLGTRMLPATKIVPKELVPIAGRPAIQWVVEKAVASGIEEIILVVSPGRLGVLEHFSPVPALESALEARGKSELLEIVRETTRLARFSTVEQREPLGLGHAVLMARAAVGDEPFAVLLPDELLRGPLPPLAQCLDVSDADCVLGVARMPRSELSRYGVVSVSRERDARTFEIDGMVEKPRPEDAPSDLVITGNPYILSPQVFDELERTPRGAGGEIQLTDALRALAKRQRFVGRIVEGERLDVGQLLGFLQGNVAMGLDDPAVGAAFAAWLRERLP